MPDTGKLPIGVFDSGVGGLTVVRALMERLPLENIVYFGDTARVPYGVKSVATIEHFTGQITSDGDQIADGVSQINHIHTGVRPGPGNTGKPVK